MAVLDAFRRGWGWVWLLGAAELALLTTEALPLLHPAPRDILATQPPAKPTAKPADSPARVSLQPILDFQPFGTPEVAAPDPVAETPVAEAAPVTPLTDGYILKGVLFREDGVPSRAILAWNGDMPASYIQGDTLPSGATLAGVEANRVWLEKDGDKQFLEFPLSGSAVTDTTEPAQPLPEDTPTAQPDAKPTMPQPDLRNLIPGLADTPQPEN